MRAKEHYKENLAKVFLQLFDVLLVVIVYLFTSLYCEASQIPSFNLLFNQLFPIKFFLSFIFLGLVWNRIFLFAGLYSFRFYGEKKSHLTKVAIYTIFTSFLFYSGMHIATFNISGRLFPFLFMLLTTVFIVATRFVLLFVIKFLREHNRNLKTVIIVGINKRSIEFTKFIASPYVGANVIGFLDTAERNDFVDEISPDKFIKKIDALNKCLAEYPVEEVIILLPIKSFYKEISSVIAECAIQGIKARYINDMFDLYEYGVFVDMVYDNDVPYLNFEKNNLSPMLLDCKRVFDIVTSFVAILLLSPLFIIIIISNYVDDGGPAFFIQKRVGMRKKHFDLYKFRSMVKNAEQLQAALENENEIDGAAFKITNDPRITKLGAFLRKTSLDELPQLFNVLIGDMSLVGPRPLPLRDYERFYRHSHRRRFSIKPGITGLWQISGRNDIDFEEWMALDLKYIDKWSPWLDFVILLKTIPAVISRKGAR